MLIGKGHNLVFKAKGCFCWRLVQLFEKQEIIKKLKFLLKSDDVIIMSSKVQKYKEKWRYNLYDANANVKFSRSSERKLHPK